MKTPDSLIENRALLRLCLGIWELPVAATAATFVAAAAFVTTTATFVAAATTTITAVATATTAATITAVATAAATAAFAAVAAATAWFEFLGLRGVHTESAALVVVAIERFNSRVQLALVAEGNESESFGSAGFAVGDDFNPFDRAVCGEESGDVFFSSGIGQVAHVDVHFCLF